MHWLAAVMAVLLVVNLLDSVWIAYTNARDLNGGGYPVLAHVLGSFLLLAIAAGVTLVDARARGDAAPALWLLGSAVIVVPVVHFVALDRADRLGSARRERG